MGSVASTAADAGGMRSGEDQAAGVSSIATFSCVAVDRGGAHLSVVAEQLGHRAIAMVERHYGHLIESFVSGTIRSTFAPLGVIDPDNVVDVKRKL